MGGGSSQLLMKSRTISLFQPIWRRTLGQNADTDIGTVPLFNSLLFNSDSILRVGQLHDR